jgi:hypothetical protein
MIDESELAELRAEIRAEIEHEQTRFMNRVIRNWEGDEHRIASSVPGRHRDHDRAAEYARRRVDRFRKAYMDTLKFERWENERRRFAREEDDGA